MTSTNRMREAAVYRASAIIRGFYGPGPGPVPRADTTVDRPRPGTLGRGPQLESLSARAPRGPGVGGTARHRRSGIHPRRRLHLRGYAGNAPRGRAATAAR